MKQSTFKMPNILIKDSTLSPSTRRIGAVLYSRRNALGLCHKSLSELAGYANCSPATVRKAVQTLIDLGYIKAQKTYRYHQGKDRSVYGKTAYACNLGLSGGYTVVRRDVFSLDLTNSGFVIYLYLLLSAGNRKRAFPSLNGIGKGVGIAHATVCRALKVLKQLPGILVQLCKTAKGKYSKSSYHFTTVLTKACSAAGSVLKAATGSVQTLPSDSANPAGIRAFVGRFVREIKKKIRPLFSLKGVVSFLANYVRT